MRHFVKATFLRSPGQRGTGVVSTGDYVPSGDMDAGTDKLIPAGDMDSGSDKFLWSEVS